MRQKKIINQTVIAYNNQTKQNVFKTNAENWSLVWFGLVWFGFTAAVSLMIKKIKNPFSPHNICFFFFSYYLKKLRNTLFDQCCPFHCVSELRGDRHTDRGTSWLIDRIGLGAHSVKLSRVFVLYSGHQMIYLSFMPSMPTRVTSEVISEIRREGGRVCYQHGDPV